MEVFDANISLTPYRAEHGFGAILFDHEYIRQADANLFAPAHWGERASPVSSGGRGGAWFVDAPFGACVLRHYLRGGMAAKVSRDRYLWMGANRTRSFAEFGLMRVLFKRGLPVPRPLAACYQRDGIWYRGAILLERIQAVRSLADLVTTAGSTIPWEKVGNLIVRFHREGLDHADLNAHNLLFDEGEKGWMIDFDRCVLRIPDTRWRERNLLRLRRSLLKLKGERSEDELKRAFERLRKSYLLDWERSC
ncbi:MAG: 3-deoxy-D-manno-octulosonic acid kinase [Xanthomonadaceae bacterium]|jgi:3-deoxy-D-manno-octulosonic acid kinase|nr:3-deoxy-D-manno-octulosonic acid kinase [Xanthomonadaceae bacterium]